MKRFMSQIDSILSLALTTSTLHPICSSILHFLITYTIHLSEFALFNQRCSPFSTFDPTKTAFFQPSNDENARLLLIMTKHLHEVKGSFGDSWDDERQWIPTALNKWYLTSQTQKKRLKQGIVERIVQG